MKKCTLFLAILLTGLLFAELSAKNGELTLTDGRVMEGDIAEKADGYDVTAPSGAVITFRKDEVKGQPEYYNTLADGYDKKKAALSKDDAKGLVALAIWAKNHKLIEQMGDAAAAALVADPNNVRAKLLMEAYQNSKKAPPTQPAVAPPIRTTPSPTPTPTPVGPGVGVQPPSPTGKLTEDDINAVRLLEMAAGDRMPMTYKRDELWNLITKLAKDAVNDPTLSGTRAQENFLGLRPEPFAQLRFAMVKINPDQYFRLAEKKVVALRTDPACLTVFKVTVNPWFVQTCGAPGCHGGSNPAAPFRLSQGKDDPSVYTNFYVLSEFVVDKNRRLLDRDRPEDSLILKFALSPDQVDPKDQHPQVNGMPVRLGSPSFPNKNARIYQLIMTWLTPSLGDDRKPEWLRTTDRVDYHITFPANGMAGPAATTQRELPPIMPPRVPVRPAPGMQTPGGVFQPGVPTGKNGPG